MNIRISKSNKNVNVALTDFLIKYSGFISCSLDEFLEFEGDKLIVIDKQDKEEELISISKRVKRSANYRTVFFLPPKYNKIFLDENINILTHPIPFKIFLKKINFLFKDNLLKFKDLKIVDNNFLLNNENNHKIYLTEIELKILCYFFKEITVEKNLIKTNILKLHKDIETKSLESHLSRIRKKIINISSDVELVSLNNNFLVIK